MNALEPEFVDHDRLFKELLTTFFVEFLELFFPDVSASLERDSLEFLDKEVFTDVTEGDRHEADIVVKARFRNADTFFIIHVENQSTSQAEFARRMFRYFARLHEKFGLPIFPIVVFSYDRPRRAETDRYQIAISGFNVLDFRYKVVQLNRLDWRDYLKQPNAAATALMAKMRIAPADRVKVRVECLRLLATLKLNPAKAQLISGFVEKYLAPSKAEWRRFEQEIEAFVPPQRRDAMELLNHWQIMGREEGLAKGRAEGQEEGRVTGFEEGRRDATVQILTRLLVQRFGDVGADLPARLAALSTTELDQFGDELLDFATPEAAHRWLDEAAAK